MKQKIKKISRVSLLLTYDVLALTISFIISNILFYDLLLSKFFSYLHVILFVKILIFFSLGLYNTLWKYASIEEFFQIIVVSIIANGACMLILNSFDHKIIYNIAVLMIILDLVFIGGSRILYRFARMIKYGRLTLRSGGIRVLIVGAGDAGVGLMKELKKHPEHKYKCVGFVDDDRTKVGKRINGVKVIGTIEKTNIIVKQKKIDEIILCIVSISEKRKKEIIRDCSQSKCKVKTLPGVFEIINGKVKFNQVREVQIDDLLGREEINLNTSEICCYLKGQKVLVTGGGGSIGSELCRQIMKYSPKELIVLDIYENNVYDLQNELLRKYKDIPLTVLIASVRDKSRINEIIGDMKPDVVFHAAAHKHVPLMESNPKAAIKNNVFGTLNVVQASDRHSVKKFVLISTDKAVNPTNIMGATKRLCEMIVQSINPMSKTEFVAVRFGNVLGSNGSVIPLFKKQISLGGPVTITHPNIVRYFMSIKEAAQLVLQTGSIAKGGEIFVLDMGQPVKIVDLARALIKLSGFDPDKDIDIQFVGLRPGEKLYEELLMDEEGIESTTHEKIFVGKPLNKEYNGLLVELNHLKWSLRKDNESLKNLLKQIVPTYKEPNEVNNKMKDFDEVATTLLD